MKVEINISNDTLVALNKQTQRVYELPIINNKEHKVVLSISYGIAEKFQKKYSSRVQNQSLFDTKKRIKMSLRFHEAWALQILLETVVDGMDNLYHKSLISALINQLDQKTC
ncbi:MAG: hypothetical protein WA775_02920 [Psychroserpens sp.]|uniref:hypothetical protein n=1 Tax=Psychroserpens sp. TaxID=2020870 RepID=UPI003CA123DA